MTLPASLRIISAASAFFLATPLSWSAITISIIANDATGKFSLPSGDPVNVGATYDFGFLDTDGFSALSSGQQRDYDALTNPDFGVFDVFGTVAFDVDGVVQVAGLPLSGGEAGQSLYALIHDASANAIGLFTSTHALWQYPSDPGSATLSNSLPVTTILGDGSLQLTAIPEPALFALVLLAPLMGGVFGRRRR